MCADERVSDWLEEVAAGDEAAATGLFNHFFARLIGLARRILQTAPRQAADEEDVVLSVFETVFRRAREGRFPRLRDRDDLWRVLARITRRKAVRQLRQQTRQKRGGGKVRGESAILKDRTPAMPAGMDQLVGPEPTPDDAAVMVETLRGLLGQLDEGLRTIALLKLEGHSNKEIAAKIDYSVRTVERRLRLIRDKWEREISDGQRLPSER